MNYCDTCLFVGLLTLQFNVTCTFMIYDLPARLVSGQEKSVQTALDHYEKRKVGLSFYNTCIPVACVFLTIGVFWNVWSSSADIRSLIILAIAFLTAVNNGKNVVDPINAFNHKKKKKVEDDPSLDDAVRVLTGVGTGHVLDFIGFTLITLIKLFL